MVTSSATAQFLMGSKANAWGEPTDSQGRVIGRPTPAIYSQPVVVPATAITPTVSITTPPVVSGYKQIDVPAVITPARPAQKLILARIFSPPAQPETTVKVEAFYRDSGNHVVRTTRTTIDKNSVPDHLAPPISQDKVPAEYSSSSILSADFGGKVVERNTQKRVHSDVTRYVDEHGWLITTVITTEEVMTYKSDYNYQLPPPEIISVPTATAGTVYGNPPGVLIVKALVTPPPKRPGARR